MPEPTPADRSRYEGWMLRLKIVSLGISLGIGARWIQSAWEAFGQPKSEPVTNSRPDQAQPSDDASAKK